MKIAIAPIIAVFDLTTTNATVDAAALKVWEDTLTITTWYGWAVTPISSTRMRYTIVYA